MDSDCYKIEVVHFINPYLIWVKVVTKSPEDFIFEQIGVYGVVPLEMTMTVEDTLKTSRSTEWMPAANVLMKNLFKDASEVLFCPVIVPESRSSIFDDSPHKFGEIVLKKHNGQHKLLSELLTKSAFALNDNDLFEQELYAGNIKTKINHHKVKDVAKVLEKKGKEQLKRQMKLYHLAEEIESKLTVANLEAHNKRNRKPFSLEEKLLMKIGDLEKCKNAEMDSVGRASSKDSWINNPALQAKYRSPVANSNQETPNDSKEVDDWDDDDSLLPNKIVPKNIDDAVEVKKKYALEEKQRAAEKIRTIMANRTKKPAKQTVAVMDPTREVKVAYGPPTSLQSLAVKVVPKEILFEKYGTTRDVAGDDDTEEVNEDLFKDVDSVVMKDSRVGVVDKRNNNDDRSRNINESHATKNDKNEFNVSKANSYKNVIIKEVDIRVPKTADVKNESLDDNKNESGSSLLRRKQRAYKKVLNQKSNSSTSDTSNKDSTTSADDIVCKDKFLGHKKQHLDSTLSKQSDNTERQDSDDNVSDVINKINEEYKPVAKKVDDDIRANYTQIKINVNPFKNVDPNLSVFVDKLVTPVLMVHSKLDKRISPVFEVRDVPFSTHIKIVLKNMGVHKPMMLQSVTWKTILRGYSIFMISPKNSGKTMGYLPSVCRLIADHDSGIEGTGPSSIIVCGTSNSVADVEMIAKMLLGTNEKVLAFYPGMSELDMTTALLNGCDLFVCTPSVLVRLLQLDFGIDIRRLTTFVLDDCERLSEVYPNELKFFFIKIKEMLKSRVAKEIKVQYVLASRIWGDFMEQLSKKVPDSVICIGAFQECVLYSKANTTASFLSKESKLKAVFSFFKEIDTSKRTVIVCRSDDEVKLLEDALRNAKYVVIACDNTMTVQDLYKLRSSWDDYQEPILGPILVCCDGNLTHLNITNAHNLLHYSLPNLFSLFCKRFSVLNDNYPSIFKQENDLVRIKILIDNANVEQLPKILHFIRRCTTDLPEVLNGVCDEVLAEKDVVKAKELVPICDNLMMLGKCPDFWNCQERHAIFEKYDEPKDWMPKEALVTFKIIYYHSPVLYSARLLTSHRNGQVVKYAQNYNMLALKISMYFSNESNQKLHGIPKVGDFCAVSIKQTFFVRAQVVKILNNYSNGKPNNVLVKLLDEERLEKTRDIYLYYLPNEMREVETYTVLIRLANIQPKDKDITYSTIAKNHLKKITEGDDDLYLRGNVALGIGNCVFVDNVETCRDLSSMSKTVVRHDFKQELIDTHAIPNPDHLPNLEKLCEKGGLKKPKQIEKMEPPLVLPPKMLPKPQWAHLEKDFSEIYFTSALDPGTFFVRLLKFDDSCTALSKDIQKYVQENRKAVTDVAVGDIVLAKLPDDDMYERARVDDIINEDKVKCFFVDHGDWREVAKDNLVEISENFITVCPFQAIECGLVGVKPQGKHWTDFSVNWFTNCFEDDFGDMKQIFVKYFTKNQPKFTDGNKYGVVLVDTNGTDDMNINAALIELGLAVKDEAGYEFIEQLNYQKINSADEMKNNYNDTDRCYKSPPKPKVSEDFSKVPLKNLFPAKPIRSVPLVESDDENVDDRWDFIRSEDFVKIFKPLIDEENKSEALKRSTNDTNLPAIKNEAANSESSIDQVTDDDSAKKGSIGSDFQVVSSLSVREIDSDDLTSPEPTQVASSDFGTQVESEDLKKSAKLTTVEQALSRGHEIENTTETSKANIKDLSKCIEIPAISKDLLKEIDVLRKPKVYWWQNKKKVSFKIMLIGVKEYKMKIEERKVKFDAEANETHYGFDLELYGSINVKESGHSNKGQYILVHLTKVLEKNWISLIRSGIVQKWIAYNMDSIDITSSEDEENNLSADDAAMMKHLVKPESDSEDDELIVDDVKFRYSK